MEGAFSSEEKKKNQQEREKNWVNIQVKGLSAWINSYLQTAKIALIKDLQKDLQDGVKLNQFLTVISGKKLTFDLTPQMKIHKIQNLSIAINYIQEQLKVRLIGISAEDIERGDIKLILGLIYSVFRTVRISKIQTQLGDGDKKKNEAQQLIAWINTVVENEPYELKLETFKDDTIKNGKAFGALLHAYNKELWDYEGMGDNSEENLKKIFEIYEQKLGIPQLLDVEEVLNGTCDERAMTLYSSLIYHAHASQEERKKLEEGSMKREQELEEEKRKKKNLEQKHDELLSENERLEKEKLDLERSKIEELERRKRAEEESERLEEERQRLEKEKQQQILESERIQQEKDQMEKEKHEEEERRKQVEREKQELEEEREKLRREKEELEKQKKEEKKLRKEQESLNQQISQQKDYIEKEKEKESELGKQLQEKHMQLMSEKDQLELRRQELEKSKDKEHQKRKKAEEESERLEEERKRLEKEKQEQILESERIQKEKEQIEKEKEEEEEKRKQLEKDKRKLELEKEKLEKEKEDERILQTKKTNEILLEKQRIEKEREKEDEIRKLLEEEKKKLEEERERLRREKEELEKEKKEQKKLRKEAERQNEKITYEKDLESKEKNTIIDELKDFKNHLTATGDLSKSLNSERNLLNDQVFLYSALMDERYEDIEDFMRKNGKLAEGESLVTPLSSDSSLSSRTRGESSNNQDSKEDQENKSKGGSGSGSGSGEGEEGTGSSNDHSSKSSTGGSSHDNEGGSSSHEGGSSSSHNGEGGEGSESAKRTKVVRTGKEGGEGSSTSVHSGEHSGDVNDEGETVIKGKRAIRHASEHTKLEVSNKDDTDKEKENSRQRKDKLKQELNELQEKIKQEINRRKKDALALKELEEKLKEYENKAIEQGEANRALDILKKNLIEHVEDLKVWVDLSELDLDSEKKEKYDPSLIRSNLKDKKFDEQIDYLAEQLQSENGSMRRILEVKDSKKQLYDNYSDKQGWLHMKTNKKSQWKSQWFVLKASELSYFPTEEKKVREGGVVIDSTCSITLLKPEDAGENKTVYPIKIKLEGGNQFYIATSTKKGRKNWVCLLKGKIVFSEYMHQIEESKTRPDIRLSNVLFATVDLGSIRMDNAPISKYTVSGIGQSLASFEDLNVVTFSSSEFTDDHASVLAPSLKKAFIRTLNLSDNHLTSNGARVICESFVENKVIESIDFSGNEIGDESSESFASLISQKKISSINLENNKITSLGAKSLLEALVEHPKWTNLQLNGNQLGDDGCKLIADLISKNESIVELQLARNKIMDVGVKHLCNALRNNTSITHIDLSGNLLTHASIAYIDDLLKDNKTIKFINVSDNAQVVGGKGLQSVFSNEAFSLIGLTLTRTVHN